MKRNWKEEIVVDGVNFRIGQQSDAEFYGPILEMKKDGKYYGALLVAHGKEDELGFCSGIYATEGEKKAAKKALDILKSKGSIAAY